MQIELKRRGLDIKEVSKQIERYRRHSYQGLQIMIEIYLLNIHSFGVMRNYGYATISYICVEALVHRALETNNNRYIAYHLKWKNTYIF